MILKIFLYLFYLMLIKIIHDTKEKSKNNNFSERNINNHFSVKKHFPKTFKKSWNYVESYFFTSRNVFKMASKSSEKCHNTCRQSFSFFRRKKKLHINKFIIILLKNNNVIINMSRWKKGIMQLIYCLNMSNFIITILSMKYFPNQTNSISNGSHISWHKKKCS